MLAWIELLPWYAVAAGIVMLISWRPEHIRRVEIARWQWNLLMILVIFLSLLLPEEGSAMQTLIRTAVFMTVFYQIHCLAQFDSPAYGFAICGVSTIQVLAVTSIRPGVEMGPMIGVFTIMTTLGLAVSALAQSYQGVRTASAINKPDDDKHPDHSLPRHTYLPRTVLLTIVFIFCSAPTLFMLFPRGTGMHEPNWRPPGAPAIGYIPDQMRLGEESDPEAGAQIVMRVFHLQNADEPIQRAMYWRGMTLDVWDGEIWRHASSHLTPVYLAFHTESSGRPTIVNNMPLYEVEYAPIAQPKIYTPGPLFSLGGTHRTIGFRYQDGSLYLPVATLTRPAWFTYWGLESGQQDLITARRRIGLLDLSKRVVPRLATLAQRTNNNEIHTLLAVLNNMQTGSRYRTLADQRWTLNQHQQTPLVHTAHDVLEELSTALETYLELDPWISGINDHTIRQSLYDMLELVALSYRPERISSHHRSVCLKLPQDAQHHALAERAHQIIQSDMPPRAQVNAISNYLSTIGYTTALSDPQAARNLLEFALEQKPGNCQFFASTLAVMLRAIGIPSRVVTGFVQGEWNPYLNYSIIRQRHAHAWVEAYLPNEGWTVWDPTPSREDEFRISPWYLQLTSYYDTLSIRWSRFVLGFQASDQKRYLGFSSSPTQSHLSAIRQWIRSLRQPVNQSLLGAMFTRAIMIGLVMFTSAGVLWWAYRKLYPRLFIARLRGASAVQTQYLSSVLYLCRKLRLKYHPAYTCAEYLQMIVPAAPDHAGVFEQLIQIYQQARFDIQQPTKQTQQRLAKLYKQLKHLPRPSKKY